MKAKHLFCIALVTLIAAFAPQLTQARTIKIYTYNGPSRKPVAVAGVTLNVADTTLSVGKTLTLTENVLPANATNKAVSWTSSNTAVATVENGLVTTLDTGVTTITVTTQDGSKTATCNVRVCFLVVDGICWAVTNVDTFQTFAERPDMYTKFYRWNRSTAWAATGNSVAGWQVETITDAAWTVNPCPTGWRLPTTAEFDALNAVGSTWGSSNARGNAVSGRFFGPRHMLCSLPNDMTDCIFMPACGNRFDSGAIDFLMPGAGSTQGRYGDYWCGNMQVVGVSAVGSLAFSSLSSGTANVGPKNWGRNIRCVK